MFFSYAIKREASLLLANAPEMTVQRLLAGRHSPIPLAYVDRIKDIAGVHSVRGRLWGYYYDPVVGANYTLIVPEAGAPEQGTIRVGAGVARARSLLAGDMIEFRTAAGEILELEAREFFSADSELVSSDLVLVSADDFLAISGGDRRHGHRYRRRRPEPEGAGDRGGKDRRPGSRTRGSSCARRSSGPTTPSSTGAAAS